VGEVGLLGFLGQGDILSAEEPVALEGGVVVAPAAVRSRNDVVEEKIRLAVRLDARATLHHES